MDTYSKPVRREETDMLTPEEVRALLLPVDPDYLIKHGIDSESDALFERDKNGILVTYH